MSETSGIDITDGAIFLMNPDQTIINGNEYVIGQISKNWK